jgi:hypothetical protein
MSRGEHWYPCESNSFASIQTEIRPPPSQGGNSRSAIIVNESFHIYAHNTRMDW